MSSTILSWFFNHSDPERFELRQNLKKKAELEYQSWPIFFLLKCMGYETPNILRIDSNNKLNKLFSATYYQRINEELDAIQIIGNPNKIYSICHKEIKSCEKWERRYNLLAKISLIASLCGIIGMFICKDKTLPITMMGGGMLGFAFSVKRADKCSFLIKFYQKSS